MMRSLLTGAGVRLVVLALLVVAVLAVPLSAGEKKESLAGGLALVPANGSGFITIRVGDLYRSDASKAFREKLAKAQPKFAEKFKKNSGLDIDQIARVTVVLGNDAERPPLVIIAMSKAVDRDKVRDAQMPKSEERKHGGKTYYTRKEAKERDQALHFASDRVLVLGSIKDMEQFLDRKVDSKGKGPLRAALGTAAAKVPLVGGLNLQGGFFGSIKKKLGEKPPPEVKEMLPLLEAKSGVATMVADKDIRLNASLTFA